MENFIKQIHYFFNITLWHDPIKQTNIFFYWLVNTIRVTFIVIRELSKGELNLRAMSLVYTTLLSLVPLIAVAFSVLKAFGVHNQLEPFLLSALEPLGPQGANISNNIIVFVQNIKVGVLGSLGVAMLFYTIIALVQKIENAFNFVWRIQQARTLTRRFTDYLSVVMIGPVLVVTAMGIAATVMNNEVVLSLQAREPFGIVLLFVSKLMPYLMIILAFTFLYMFIPNTRVEFKSAFIGGIVAGILWVTIGKVFASFVASSSSYTAIYSSFAILFFFMIWLYLGWLILLTGSQVTFYLQHPKLIRLGRQYSLSPRQREQEGLWLMVLIAKQFYQQRPALTLQELELHTQLATELLQELLVALVKGALIVELAGEKISYVPATDSSEIKVKDILDCLRQAEETSEFELKSKAAKPVITLLQKLDENQTLVLANMTLRELCQDQLSA